MGKNYHFHKWLYGMKSLLSRKKDLLTDFGERVYARESHGLFRDI